MKTKNEILAKIEELNGDERHKYKPALVQINAPLALTQVEIQAKIDALAWVLGGIILRPIKTKNGYETNHRRGAHENA
jgi:hypothetical protein